MNMWGATPLIAAALLRAGTGVHATAANQFGAAGTSSMVSPS
jgi:hypothetical protein